MGCPVGCAGCAARGSPHLAIAEFDCQPCPRKLVWYGVPIQEAAWRRAPDCEVVNVHDMCWDARARREAVVPSVAEMTVESAVWKGIGE